MATLKSINVNSIREGDGKVDEGVGFEATLILRSGVDFTDITLVYKDADQHKAHKIILS